jgi:type III pantothenate kinase
MLSSTIDIPQDLLTAIERFPRHWVLDQHTKLPFSNRYRSKDTLGKDRIALVAAASSRFPHQDNLVIGCGTCITFNFIDAGNAFLGGSIHPGLKMRLRAMHHFTGKLPDLELTEHDELIGTDTSSSMMTGTLFGAAREIDGMINEYLVKFPQMNIIITGGDADLLVSRLKNKIFAIPDCTLIGLNHILQHNAQ